jgi:hypothetical protein
VIPCARGAEAITAGPSSDALILERQALFRNYFPAPAELGAGWLLPWELPKEIRKHESREAFWRSGAAGWLAAGKDGAGGEMGPVILSLVGLPREQLRNRVDALIASLVSEAGDDLSLSGVSAEQFFAAMLLLRARAELSPSLAETMGVELDYLREILPIMRRQIEAKAKVGEGVTGKADDEDKASPNDDSTREIMQAVVKLFKGKSAAQLRQDIVDEVLAVNRSTAMSYARCDNWKALESGEADAARVHLGFVTVRMLLLDRQRMARAKTDLNRDEANKLKARLNEDIRSMLTFAKEAEEAQMKREVEALEKNRAELQAAKQAELEQQLENDEKNARKSLEALKKARDEAAAKARRSKSQQASGATSTQAERGTTDGQTGGPSRQQAAEGTTPERSVKEYERLIADQEKEIAEALPRRRRERVAELDKASGEERARVETEKREREEQFNAFREGLRMEADVYLRDIGDNSYVIRLGGNARQLDMAGGEFPYGALNASLRNGNAVIHIILSGNFSEQQLRDELDRFLAEMDARTEAFRE